MRIFLKNIGPGDIKYLKNFPIQGLVFSISQKNAEKVRDIIEQVPFYLSILGEINSSLKYEIEELIFFCKLKGLITADANKQEVSCFQIPLIDYPYNSFVINNGKIATGHINLKMVEDYPNIEALVLDREQFIDFWPLLLKIWTNYKVV